MNKSISVVYKVLKINWSLLWRDGRGNHTGQLNGSFPGKGPRRQRNEQPEEAISGVGRSWRWPFMAMVDQR